MTELDRILARYPNAETYKSGDSAALNAQILDLMRRGRKTMTCEAWKVFGPDGDVIDHVEHHNRVLDGGRLWLLNLLKGDSTIGGHDLILGAEGFKPNIAKPLEQDTVVPVKLTGTVSTKMSGKELIVTFRGNAERKAVVIGGGIVIGGKRGNRETKDLYNFAETPRPIEMQEGQSVSVNFRLAME